MGSSIITGRISQPELSLGQHTQHLVPGKHSVIPHSDSIRSLLHTLLLPTMRVPSRSCGRQLPMLDCACTL